MASAAACALLAVALLAGRSALALVATSPAHADLFAFPKSQVLFGSLPGATGRVSLSSGSDLLSGDDGELDENTIIMPVSSTGETYICHIPNTNNSHDSTDSNTSNRQSIGSRSPATDTERKAAAIALLAPMSASCIYHPTGWWSYELCHGHSVRQFHAMTPEEAKRHPPNTKIEFSLGRFEQESIEVADVEIDGRVSGVARISYGGGTVCDVMDAGMRRTVVVYMCGEWLNDVIVSVRETGSCRYEMTVMTRRLCSHPLFAPRRIDVAHGIHCEALSPASSVTTPAAVDAAVDMPSTSDSEISLFPPLVRDVFETEAARTSLRGVLTARGGVEECPHALTSLTDFMGSRVYVRESEKVVDLTAGEGTSPAVATALVVDVAEGGDVGSVLMKIVSRALGEVPAAAADGGNEGPAAAAAAASVFTEGRAVALDEAVREIRRRLEEEMLAAAGGGDKKASKKKPKKKSKKSKAAAKVADVEGDQTAPTAKKVVGDDRGDAGWTQRFQDASMEERAVMIDEFLKENSESSGTEEVAPVTSSDSGDEKETKNTVAE